MDPNFALFRHLQQMGELVCDELAETITLEERNEVPAIDVMKLEVPHWYRVADVVAVVADLKGSTRFNTGRNEKTIARFYEAYMRPLIEIAERWNPSFVDIQGDGLFALFDGNRLYERAFVTGVTMQAFVEGRLLPALAGRLSGLPDTGLKVGIAAGPVFVKRVGVKSRNEPIWAGWPVNLAAKCAQKADAGALIVTPQVWTRVKGNDYVRRPCVCGWRRYMPALASPWQPTTVDRLPDRHCRCELVRGWWCEKCGDRATRAILSGEATRS